MPVASVSIGTMLIVCFILLFAAARRSPTTIVAGDEFTSGTPAPFIADVADRSKSNLHLILLSVGIVLYSALMTEGRGDGIVSLVHAQYLASAKAHVVVVHQDALHTLSLFWWFLIALPICVGFSLNYRHFAVLLPLVFGAIISSTIIDLEYDRPFEDIFMARYHYAHCSSKDFKTGVGRGRGYYSTYEPDNLRCSEDVAKPQRR